MGAQNPTINLVDFRSLAMAPGGHPTIMAHMHFKIESLKNTVDYHAGTWLEEITVKDLVNMGWNVNIRATKNSDF